jgi:hypothetical protein
MIGCQSVYDRLLIRIATNPFLPTVLILLLTLPGIIVRQYYQTTGLRNHKHETKAGQKKAYPWWITFILLLSPALEYPFLLALHPVALAYPADSIRPPSPFQLCLQTISYLIIQTLVGTFIKQFIHLSTPEYKVLHPLSKATASHCEEDPDYEVLNSITKDFINPRATLLISVAILAWPSPIREYCGQLHAGAMILWVVIYQLSSEHEA